MTQKKSHFLEGDAENSVHQLVRFFREQKIPSV